MARRSAAPGAAAFSSLGRVMEVVGASPLME